MTLLEQDMEVIYKLPALAEDKKAEWANQVSTQSANPENDPKCLGCGKSGARINGFWFCFTDECSFFQIQTWKVDNTSKL